MIPVGKLKVEDARKMPIFEAQVPRREVAMDDPAGPGVQLQPSNSRAGTVEMPPDNTDLFWSGSLVIGQDTVQRRVAQDLLTAPPRATLPKPTELRQVGVERSQEPSARCSAIEYFSEEGSPGRNGARLQK